MDAVVPLPARLVLTFPLFLTLQWTKEDGHRTSTSAVPNLFVPLNTNPKEVQEMRNKVRTYSGVGGQRPWREGGMLAASGAGSVCSGPGLLRPPQLQLRSLVRCFCCVLAVWRESTGDLGPLGLDLEPTQQGRARGCTACSCLSGFSGEPCTCSVSAHGPALFSVPIWWTHRGCPLKWGVLLAPSIQGAECRGGPFLPSDPGLLSWRDQRHTAGRVVT